MSVMASQIIGISIVYSTVCSGADQRQYQSSASPAFLRGIHRWPMNSPHKGPVTRKMFPFDGVIMQQGGWICKGGTDDNNYQIVIHSLVHVLDMCGPTSVVTVPADVPMLTKEKSPCVYLISGHRWFLITLHRRLLSKPYRQTLDDFPLHIKSKWSGISSEVFIWSNSWKSL